MTDLRTDINVEAPTGGIIVDVELLLELLAVDAVREVTGWADTPRIGRPRLTPLLIRFKGLYCLASLVRIPLTDFV
jgi:hypothetical protein